jgi:hypothetical protein
MTMTRFTKNGGTGLCAISAFIVFCLTLVACNDSENTADLSVIQQPLGVSGGGVPLPVTMCLDTPEECESFVPEESWGGSYSELLAADAFAECTLLHAVNTDIDLTQLVDDHNFWERDEFILRIYSYMQTAQCSWTVPLNPEFPVALHNWTPTEAWMYSWLWGRSYPECNINPLTREAEGLDFALLTDDSAWKRGSASHYWIPDVADLEFLADPATPFEASMARRRAQTEIHYAYVNVCMASKLSEHLDSIQVAFTSTDELKRLRSIIQERALTAVHQYGLLARALGGFKMACAE